MHEDRNRSWTCEYKITSLLTNPQGSLGLYGALNLIQETAWLHAEDIGFGLNTMNEAGLYWVLTRQSLHMEQWPRMGATIQVKTWLCPPQGAFVTREFILYDEAQKILGSCSTTWLALDRHTKKILPAQDLRPWAELTSPPVTGITPDKIPVSGSYEKLAKFRVRNSDLDINQHVNNTKYAQWILDAIPYSLHRSLKLKTYTVNFLAETHLGDKVEIERAQQSSDVETSDHGHSQYRGVRLSDNKILFTALLTWEKKA